MTNSSGGPIWGTKSTVLLYRSGISDFGCVLFLCGHRTLFFSELTYIPFKFFVLQLEKSISKVFFIRCK